MNDITDIKIGDIVIAIEEHDNNTDIIGKKGRVIDNQPRFSYCAVEFFEPIQSGHDYYHKGKDGHCWSIHWNKLMKVPITRYTVEDYE
jgi:hypothetical protein